MNNIETRNDARIEVRGVDYSVENTQILHSIQLSIRPGELVGLIGPNGCGKTTLLKTIYRVYQPTGGAVFLDGQNVHKQSRKSVAKKMAVLSQEMSASFDFSVIEVVLMGRFAHKRILESNSGEDYQICSDALELVGMATFKDRSFLSLSGGEKQRVLLAAAYAQKTGVILLDEPTNHLDIGYQLMIMDIIRDIPGITVFASLHDMNIAARYCDRLIAIDHGRIAAVGSPEEVLTQPLIEKLFHVKTHVSKEPDTGKISISYLSAVRS